MDKGFTIETIMEKPEADLVVNHIIERRRGGLYSLILFHGLPGSGKSSGCFRTKELIVEKYPNERVVFNLITCEKDLAKFALEAREDEVWIGIADELSVLFPSRRSMAGANVNAMAILDTLRKKKAILLCNAPLWTSVDSHIRLMANVYVETLKVFKKAGIVVSKFFRLQTNIMQGKTYFHAFQREGREVKLMYTRMPNMDDWKAYELKKDEFMKELYEKILKKAEKREEKEDKELGIVRKRKATNLSPQEAKVYHMKMAKQMTNKEISEEFGVSPSRICVVYKNVLKKLNFTKENPEIDGNSRIYAPINKIIEVRDNDGGLDSGKDG